MLCHSTIRTSDNTAYTLEAYTFFLRDIAPFDVMSYMLEKLYKKNKLDN